jgi:spore germination cell wall hydrolase CwlJ-like protein
MLAAGRLFAKFLACCTLSWLAINSAGPAAASDESEVRCLALTIYFEARGESELGQRAVGHVVMNRTRDADFPRTVCGVVQQGGEARNECQFSWWCDGLSDRPRDKSALLATLDLAMQIYHGCSNDPTAGALWYHTPKVRPAWSRKFGRPHRIGAHVFYRGTPDKRRLTKAFATTDEPSAACGPASSPAKRTDFAAR